MNTVTCKLNLDVDKQTDEQTDQKQYVHDQLTGGGLEMGGLKCEEKVFFFKLKTEETYRFNFLEFISGIC